jgi:hypothetical protein
MRQTSKPAMDRVRNPQGRADWLAASCLKEVVRRSSNPALAAAYQMSRGEVEDLLKSVLGPKTAAGRKVKKAIQTGKEILGELRSC